MPDVSDVDGGCANLLRARGKCIVLLNRARETLEIVAGLAEAKPPRDQRV